MRALLVGALSLFLLGAGIGAGQTDAVRAEGAPESVSTCTAPVPEGHPEPDPDPITSTLTIAGEAVAPNLAIASPAATVAVGEGSSSGIGSASQETEKALRTIRAAAYERGHTAAGAERLIRIAWCESQMGLYPRNWAGSGAGGVPFHWMPETWRVASGLAGLPGASRDDPAANVSVAAFWVLHAGWQEFACIG